MKSLMRSLMKSSGPLVFAAGVLVSTCQARAADYPSAPIKLVVGFAPGGASDTGARLVAEKLALALKQPVVVENRPGATGVIAAQTVAKGPPDGYTLLWGTGELVTNTVTKKASEIHYDVLKDFVPIAQVANVKFVLVVAAQSPIASAKDLVARAKAKPDSLTYASFGIGGANHLLTGLFLADVGASAIHVPYKGSQLAIAGLEGGEVDFSFETLGTVLPQIQAGKVRALATPSARRLSELPEVATLRELGFADGKLARLPNWMGLFAPAGTPAPVIATVSSALTQVLADPELRRRFNERGLDVVASQPDAFKKTVEDEMSSLPGAIKEAGITLD